MTPLHPTSTPPTLPQAQAHTHAVATAQAVGHLVCDPQGRVHWSDALAARLLASAWVLQLQPDGRLGARSHRLGLLALRSAMRLATLGTPAVPLTLRHGRDELLVGVHALPDAADGTPRVLLSLRPVAPGHADSTPWRT